MKPRVTAPLDPGFQPVILFNRNYRGDTPLVIGLERENGLISRFEARVRATADDETIRYVERIVKFLLWARGGWRLYLDGPRAVCERISIRPFDADLMARVYERPVEIVLGIVPAAKEMATALGGHLDGCRIGFDLGASDYKVAAVNEGSVVYSDEFHWNPRDQSDPQYHYDHITSGLRKAAAHLPRVDAIGGSSAGVIVDNKIMAASLFRGVPEAKRRDGENTFLRLRKEWGVPFEVLNDGDVTALAGGMSLKTTGVLGIAMGSSQAGGFLDKHGHLLGWLSELAFVPVDYNPSAPADEWSGDRGVGALYFSQQAVNKLLPAAGIDVPPAMGLPERLKEVQKLMAQGDKRATKIYETIGVYLGYAIPHYADFYDFQHALILGRVTTGEGGNILIQKAREVLKTEFPEIAEKVQLHVPDEKSRRVGQSGSCGELAGHYEMKLHNSTADIFVPDNQPVDAALKRITHLGIGAHHDDLEFMAFHGILECLHSDAKWFGGVTCTNGGGSSRTGVYAKFTDEQMQQVRRKEQNAAAVVGRYGAMLQLDYPSSVVKSAADTTLKDDLKQIIAATRAQVVYTHNPADKHDTHIGVVVAALQAMRELPVGQRPGKVIGCEVWRNLDWLTDSEKVVMDVSAHENLAMALNGIFDSQIAGGKRYDIAVQGRRRANATFFESHASDKTDQVWFGMDLTPLVKDEKLDIVEYVTGYVRKFEADVRAKLGKRLGSL